jgi:amino acid transporter
VSGSWLGLALVIISFLAQLFAAIAPPRTLNLVTAEEVFKAYLALPVVLFF